MKIMLTAFAFSLAIATPALANTCGKKQDMSTVLAERFGEQPFASGISDDTTFKFFGNAQTGTWSILAIGTNGTACIAAIGDGLAIERQGTQAATPALLIHHP